jgi:predicted nucleic acid-binding protein
MLYLLDTNMISGVVRENPAILDRLAALKALDEAVTCTIVKGELLFGVARMPKGRKRDELDSSIHAVLSSIRSVPVPDYAAQHYAAIKQSRRSSGRPILENDLWIAATSLAIGAVLVSHDRDVTGIAGLPVEDWW